jgi:HD-GYP domain-containing protein (c-di-GMP phosphodiesterase class II)
VNHPWILSEQIVERGCETSTITDLLEIGNALSQELDLDRLLELILSKSRAITCSDAGSIYLIDRQSNPAQLLFKVAQNDSLADLTLVSKSIPLDSHSLAGHVGRTGDILNIGNAYELPAWVSCELDRQFDIEQNYLTVSALILPMKNSQGETIGVLQLINRKLDPDLKIEIANARTYTQSFPKWQQEVIQSLASQAAISIERDRLITSIETAFAGFVTAAVSAIEQRDPATAGHSERVATLSVRLCEEVNRVDIGKWRSISFDARQLQEMRYAALLHDFGKICIPEAILQKEKKLYPSQLREIEQRFALVRQTWQVECAEAKFAYLVKNNHEHLADTACFHCSYIEHLDRDLMGKLDRLKVYWNFILELNQPDLLRSPKFSQDLIRITTDLHELSQYTYRDFAGNSQPLLTASEIEQLLIPRGSLTDAERKIVESHVIHTINFLDRIPWSDRLQNVTAIAAAHHEKLDGSGYPYGLTAALIPVRSQVVAIADIYDALAASDRPYKPRLSLERTLGILHQEATNGKIDADLLALFEQRQVYLVIDNGN